MKMHYEKPLVTVCIPAYNHEAYISEAIISIIEQSYENIELIVINDGSSDKTDLIIQDLESYCKNRFSSYKYLSRENRGLVYTLNEMISMSRGKYIKLIASDDVMKKELVAECIEILEEKGKEIVFFNLDIINENSEIIRANVPGIKGLGQDLKSLHSAKLSQLLEYNRFYGPAYMVRSSVYSKIGSYSVDIAVEDWDFLLRCFEYKLSVHHLNKSLVNYRHHEDNTWKKTGLILANNLKILSKYDYVFGHEQRLANMITRSINALYHAYPSSSPELNFFFKVLESQINSHPSIYLRFNLKSLIKLIILWVLYLGQKIARP